MGRYTDVPCAKCGARFAESDNVVVCPICGAPHHKDCYDELGHCANIADHERGIEWKNPAQKGAEAAHSCPKCGAPAPADGVFCQFCGTRLSDGAAAAAQQRPLNTAQEQQNPYYAPPQQQHSAPGVALETSAGPIAPDENFDGVSAKEIAIYLGPNSRYFLTQFKIMKETGRKYSFNLPAFFLNFAYFAHRKMYTLLAAGLVLFAFINLPSLIYAPDLMRYYLNEVMGYSIGYNMEVIAQVSRITSVLRIVQYAGMFVFSVVFNRMYYGEVIKNILKVKSNFAMTIDNRAYYSALARKGRTSVGTAVLTVLAVFAVFTVLIYLFSSEVLALVL